VLVFDPPISPKVQFQVIGDPVEVSVNDTDTPVFDGLGAFVNEAFNGGGGM
jgi:hypothetical protein